MSKPKIPPAAAAMLGAKHAAPPPPAPPEPITRATINRMDDGFTVNTSDRYSQRRTTAHTTLAAALAELTRAMSPPAKAAKPAAQSAA